VSNPFRKTYTRFAYVPFYSKTTSVSHLLHEAFLGMRSVLFWTES
jgi:hypothetical protein